MYYKGCKFNGLFWYSNVTFKYLGLYPLHSRQILAGHKQGSSRGLQQATREDLELRVEGWSKMTHDKKWYYAITITIHKWGLIQSQLYEKIPVCGTLHDSMFERHIPYTQWYHIFENLRLSWRAYSHYYHGLARNHLLCSIYVSMKVVGIKNCGHCMSCPIHHAPCMHTHAQCSHLDTYCTYTAARIVPHPCHAHDPTHTLTSCPSPPISLSPTTHNLLPAHCPSQIPFPNVNC